LNGFASDVGNGLNAALLLARGRREGLEVVSPAGADAARVAGRSFWAIALSLPAFICLHLLDWTRSGVPDHAATAFAADLLTFGIYWIGYAVVSHAVAGALGRAARWPRYIALWNWCNLVQYLMVTAAALPVLLGMPSWVSQAADLFSTGWALWLEWFATRLALDVSPVVAGVITLADLLAGMFLFGLTGSG
jgi:hypothetical protein